MDQPYKMNLKSLVKHNAILLGIIAPIYRFYLSLRYLNSQAKKILIWLINSREITNHTYYLPRHNIKELAYVISHALQVDRTTVEQYFDEIESDINLRNHISEVTNSSQYKSVSDKEVRYGQRVAWYAVTRICKPKLIVETGLDKGLGTCTLAAALMSNAAKEGEQGKILAVDINPEAGWLIETPYDKHVEFLNDDSISALSSIDKSIDLFIYDSVRNSVHEQQEYEIISNKLRKGSIIISTTTHHSEALMNFAQELDEDYYSWLEIPKDHFYPGGGLGIVRISHGSIQ